MFGRKEREINRLTARGKSLEIDLRSAYAARQDAEKSYLENVEILKTVTRDRDQLIRSEADCKDKVGRLTAERDQLHARVTELEAKLQESEEEVIQLSEPNTGDPGPKTGERMVPRYDDLDRG